jgi:hypothetical protein
MVPAWECDGGLQLTLAYPSGYDHVHDAPASDPTATLASRLSDSFAVDAEDDCTTIWGSEAAPELGVPGVGTHCGDTTPSTARPMLIPSTVSP